MSGRRPPTILEVPARAAIGMVAAMVVACGASANPGTSAATTGPTPSAAALASPVAATVTGQPIDDIKCDASGPQLVIHDHAHLVIFVNGAARAIPKNIGILASLGGVSCTYWLHSHDDDGIIHVESPVMRTFTLGNYFDVWGLQLDSNHVGPASGPVTVYLNGQPFAGDVRGIPLTAHSLMQLDVSGNVAPVPYTFPTGD